MDHDVLRHQMEDRFREEFAKARQTGVWGPGWSANQVDQVYVGVDGVMVRGVTETEKNKRRRQHEVRRMEREQARIANTATVF